MKLTQSLNIEYISVVCRGKSLPDGGASLRQTIRSDKARLIKMRDTLAKARQQFARLIANQAQ
jgi:hypothetical protein